MNTVAHRSRFHQPSVPSAAEQEMARTSARELNRVLDRPSRLRALSVTVPNQQAETIPVPPSALPVIVEVLSQLAQGRAVTVIPVNSELTTQQAADFIGVSRPHFVKLLKQKRLPFRRVGTHRRVKFADLQAFQSREQKDRQKVLDELTAESQRLSLGY